LITEEAADHHSWSGSGVSDGELSGAPGLGEVFTECLEGRAAHVMLDPLRIGVRAIGINPQRYQEFSHHAVALA
jgi:hypothetical protein